MTVATSLPTAELAACIAASVIGAEPTALRRFATGARHYVFDVEFADRPAVVVRIGGSLAHSAWLRHAARKDDRVFRLYLAMFLLDMDLMAEHGQVFNGNERPSVPEARVALRRAFEESIRCRHAPT